MLEPSTNGSDASGVINDEWQRAEKAFRAMGQPAHEPLATGMYAKLRKTWERTIEEVLFNQVVLRFRDGVETKRLKADITQGTWTRSKPA